MRSAQHGWVAVCHIYPCAGSRADFKSRSWSSHLLQQRFKGPRSKQRYDHTVGKAFYRRQADYFVLPYSMLLCINVVVASCSAAFWSISAVAAAQILRQLHIHFPETHFLSPVWYRVVVLYGIIALAFVVVLNLQALAAILWVILTKWIVIGRRQAGKFEWDKSSYCQRWQLHLVLSRPLYKGYGNGGILLP